MRHLIEEFFRVIGLPHVVAGRGEYYTAVAGTCQLRDQLTALMLEELTLPDAGGALHLSRLLSPEQMEILEALPLPKPNRAEVIVAHVGIAQVFLPPARALAARLDLEWPSAFEAATRRVLAGHFGAEIEIRW